MIIVVEKEDEQLINWNTETEKDKAEEMQELMQKINAEEKIDSVTLEFLEDTPISYANSLFSGQVSGERVKKQTIILSK